MRPYTVVFGIVLLAGCAAKPEPLPPVPPVPPTLWEQEIGWRAPETVEEPQEAPVVIPPPPRPAGDNETVYDWREGQEYEIAVQLGWPVDVQLEPGELISDDVDGDRAPVNEEAQEKRWQKVLAMSGQEYDKHKRQQHLFYTCTHPGQRQGVMVATTRRMYYLSLKCVGKTPIRVVRWNYPAPPAQSKAPKLPGALPDPTQPYRYQVGYVVTVPPGAEAIAPTHVLNDKEHIYLIFPPTMLAEQAPMVREIGPTGPNLVNSRQPAGRPVLVVDGLSPRLELRYGEGDHALIVTVTRSNLTQILCPGDVQCPVWPRTQRRVVQDQGETREREGGRDR